MVVDGGQLDNSSAVVVNGEQDTERVGSLSNSDMETEEDHFECVCGLEDYFHSSDPIVCCRNCGVLQHADCIFYDPDFLKDDDVYTCPYCLINKSVSLHS